MQAKITISAEETKGIMQEYLNNLFRGPIILKDIRTSYTYTPQLELEVTTLNNKPCGNEPERKEDAE